MIEGLDDGYRPIIVHDVWHEFKESETKVGEAEQQYNVLNKPKYLKTEGGGIVEKMVSFDGGWVNLERICIGQTYRCLGILEDRLQSIDGKGLWTDHGMKVVQMFKSYKSLWSG